MHHRRLVTAGRRRPHLLKEWLFMRTRVLGSLLCSLAIVGCADLEQSDTVDTDLDQDKLGETQSKVVYGTDNRTDVYAHADATLRARAQQATLSVM
jgi:hypothetical protein